MILPGISLHSALFHAGNSETSVSTRKSTREISQAVAWVGDVEKQLSEKTHAFCSDNKGLWTCWKRDRKQVAEGKNVIRTLSRTLLTVRTESMCWEFCFILTPSTAFSLSDIWTTAVHSWTLSRPW